MSKETIRYGKEEFTEEKLEEESRSSLSTEPWKSTCDRLLVSLRDRRTTRLIRLSIYVSAAAVIVSLAGVLMQVLQKPTIIVVQPSELVSDPEGD